MVGHGSLSKCICVFLVFIFTTSIAIARDNQRSHHVAAAMKAFSELPDLDIASQLPYDQEWFELLVDGIPILAPEAKPLLNRDPGECESWQDIAAGENGMQFASKYCRKYKEESLQQAWLRAFVLNSNDRDLYYASLLHYGFGMQQGTEDRILQSGQRCEEAIALANGTYSNLLGTEFVPAWNLDRPLRDRYTSSSITIENGGSDDITLDVIAKGIMHSMYNSHIGPVISPMLDEILLYCGGATEYTGTAILTDPIGEGKVPAQVFVDMFGETLVETHPDRPVGARTKQVFYGNQNVGLTELRVNVIRAE